MHCIVPSICIIRLLPRYWNTLTNRADVALNEHVDPEYSNTSSYSIPPCSHTLRPEVQQAKRIKPWSKAGTHSSPGYMPAVRLVLQHDVVLHGAGTLRAACVPAPLPRRSQGTAFRARHTLQAAAWAALQPRLPAGGPLQPPAASTRRCLWAHLACLEVGPARDSLHTLRLLCAASAYIS